MTDPALTTPASELDEIGEQVITLLTRASRLQRAMPEMLRGPAAVAAEPPRLTEPVDFAGFLVPLLGAVAANRGSVAALLAGPRQLGSRCPAHPAVQRRLRDRRTAQRLSARTDPDRRVDRGRPGHRGPRAAGPGRAGRAVVAAAAGPRRELRRTQMSALDQAESEARTALEARFADRDLHDPERIAAQDRLTAEFTEREAALRARWKARYERYLAAFRDTVLAHAPELGITVPIEVTGETDPAKTYTAARTVTDLWHRDTLAALLYEHAAIHTPTDLLTTDVPEDTPGHHGVAPTTTQESDRT
ncbi:hypothetical protein [Nocardia thailandica]